MKKALSVLLALCLLAGALPLGALPLEASASDVHSGSCGPNAKYTFSGDTLTISGTGATYDYWSKPTLSGWNDPAPYWVYSPLIKHIVIEEGITSLGDNSFQWGDDYVKLVSVQFPESLEEIGEKAFAKTPLTEIHLPKGIKRIGDWAFEETKISTIQVTRAIYGQGIFRNCENLKTITYLDEGTGPWYPEFRGCNGLTSVTIPGYVKDVEGFPYCTNLETVVMEEGVEAIPQGAFQGCKNLREVRMPETSLKSIGKYAFYQCSKLKTFVIPRSDPTLSNDIFWTMSKLRNVIVPKEIEYVYGNVFSGCDELWNIYEESAEHSFIHVDYAFPYGDRKFAMIMNGDRGARHYSFDIDAFGFQSGLTDREPDDASATPTPKPTPSPTPTSSPSPTPKPSFNPSPSPDPTPDPVPDNRVTIVYEAGEGSGYMAPQTVESGKRYTVAECGFTPPAGKVFHRWGRKDSSLVYDPGETPIAAAAPGSTITYVAQWKEDASADPTPEPDPEGRVTVLYVPIEGWGDMDSQLVEPGTRYTIAECAYNPPIGKVFDCWVEVPGGQTWYPGETPLAPDTPGAYVIYHAQWKEDAGTTPSISFVDVKEDSWFAGAVVWAVENGITSGKGSSATFKPNDTCTRAEIMTFLWASEGRPSASSAATFSDMPSLEAFRNAISWAVEKGITGGIGGNKFGSAAPCTRAQAVTFLWAAAGRPQPASMASFSDMTGNSAYDTAISWAVENSVTSGAGNNSFHPNKRCTRAEIVTFLQAASNARF